jgi:hypothetical protein
MTPGIKDQEPGRIRPILSHQLAVHQHPQTAVITLANLKSIQTTMAVYLYLELVVLATPIPEPATLQLTIINRLG